MVFFLVPFFGKITPSPDRDWTLRCTLKLNAPHRVKDVAKHERSTLPPIRFPGSYVRHGGVEA
jgi:hypothetical protein